jgi:diketogulonate reductase-like aldo/keto reductase
MVLDQAWCCTGQQFILLDNPRGKSADYSEKMNLTPKIIPQVALADGTRLPALGLGTWKMGERMGNAAREVTALKRGLDLGMTLIDTAEMYGDGGAEKVVARAIAGRHGSAFVVSKVYPHNAGARSMTAACERSLRRLAIDCIDLYLLHWRGRIPLAESVDTFERLRAAGKIARWGVSNFDTADMEELYALPAGGNCAVNQVLYNLLERGIEWRLLEWCRARRVAVMAYSPVAQGSLLTNPKLAAIARQLDVTSAELALAWVLTRPQVIAIPQSSNIAHIESNRAAVAVRVDDGVLAALDAAFAPPQSETRLSVI